MDRKYGIGVIGVGVWGCHSLEHDMVSTGRGRVVAVSTEERWGEHCFSEDPVEYGKAYAQRFDADFRCDWREVVEDPEVDIISVMVCPREKRDVVVATLRYGKHVVTDKPLGLTAEDAKAIVGAERGSTGQGMMLAGYHVHPLVGHLIQEVHMGHLGEIRAVSMRLVFMGGVYPGFVPTRRWRDEVPGGEMTTIGSHAFVTLQRIANTPARELYATKANKFYASYEAVCAEDWAEINLRFQSNAVANVTVGRLPYHVPNGDITIEVTGTDGYAELASGRLTFWPGEEVIEAASDAGTIQEETFRRFYDAIESGTATPTTFSEGLVLHEILDAAYSSARKGKAVSL